MTALQKELDAINEFLQNNPESPLVAGMLARKAELIGSGAIAQGKGATAVGQDGIGVGGDMKDSTLIKGDHNRVNQTTNVYNGSPPVKILPLDEAMQKYLDYLIAHHQYLQLQGIRAGSHPLSVALEKVYVSLSILDKHQAGHKIQSQGTDNFHSEPGADTVASAMRRYRRLVIIGDPGCGKTTLLAYLTLTYARDRHEASGTVKSRLGLDDAGHLPITLPLRALGYHLHDKNIRIGNEGAALLLGYLRDYYLAQNIALPEDFFVDALDKGRAVLLLDGMDEVADIHTRQSVARLIEAFAARYSKARFVVTSREVGYDGAARIGAEFGLAKVRDFSPAEVRQFVKDWARVVETTFAQSNASPRILGDEDLHAVVQEADNQSDKLTQAIENNVRVAELAVNPLLLTVIALVHRYRAQLPERRSELYEESVEVLLGHWDSAKGLEDELDVAGIRMDSGDRRSFLEPVAFWMHEHNQREIELADLRDLLLSRFKSMTGDTLHAEKAVDAFLRVINERNGLLIARGIGVYGFVHLTFPEYLVARALADRKDALEFTLKHLSDTWWREVILLQAGYLSTQGKCRVSELIGVLMNADPKTEPEPHHHLLLAAECLFDVGLARADGNLLEEVRGRLKMQADAPIKKGNKASLLGKLTAMNALACLESGKIASQFWKAPYGEPEWITIPAGEFWMGGEGQYDEKPVHRFNLPEYQIARVPVTNAQYALYVQDAKDAKVKPPEHWRGGSVPPGLENHPVVNVTWDEALAYCQWLGKKVNKTVTLPSEAEWEKAARGDKDKRAYPWGESWKELQCNSIELDLNDTTPVGLFLGGASPYGLLDMSGNVWEWTRTIWDDKFKYPYKIKDGRENLQVDTNRVLRGGSFHSNLDSARCAFRYCYDYWDRDYGFRVAVVVVFSRASL